MCDDYVKGDTVGIRIPKPDRTNTSRNILTCKVLEKKDNRYKLYSPSGILGTSFAHTDLLDFRNIRFEDIETVEPSRLDKVAFAKAARESSGFIAKKTLVFANAKESATTINVLVRKTIWLVQQSATLNQNYV